MAVIQYTTSPLMDLPPEAFPDTTNYFNFTIGYISGGRLCTYMYFNSEIHYDDEFGARNFLAYVKDKSPEHEWKIIRINADE